MNTRIARRVFRLMAVNRRLGFPVLCLLFAIFYPLPFVVRGDTACGDSAALALDNGNCAVSDVFVIDNANCAESELFVINNCTGTADFDSDGDVDLTDLAGFTACARGSAVPHAAGCEPKDFDRDGDVDQSDFGTFQQSFGRDPSVNPSCTD